MEFKDKCPETSMYKHQQISCLLHKMSILEYVRNDRKMITIYFVDGLPNTLGKFNFIWVLVDKFTKSTPFIMVRIDYNIELLAKVYVNS